MCRLCTEVDKSTNTPYNDLTELRRPDRAPEHLANGSVLETNACQVHHSLIRNSRSLTFLLPHQRCVIVFVVFPSFIQQLINSTLLERSLVKGHQLYEVVHFVGNSNRLTFKQELYSLNKPAHSLLSVVPMPRRYSVNIGQKCQRLSKIKTVKQTNQKTDFRCTISRSRYRSVFTSSRC